jgi:general secretion pathway protein A
MYERFFGFRERPFDLTPNPRYLVLTEGHREALSNLEYAIGSRKGVTLLLGDAGVGKTTVIRAALERQTSRVSCVHLHNPSLTRSEFVEMLAVRFNLSDRARESKTVLLVELESLLRQRYTAQESTVLIIDEAQSLSFELLEEIRLLANIETNEEKLLSLIIAGQPELADRLEQSDLRQLKQRVALRCELRALTLQETLAYAAGRIRAAGGEAAKTFTREAVTLLYESSGGIPRAINVLADNALLAGFARGQRPVTRDVISEVARDFSVGGGASGSAGRVRGKLPTTVLGPSVDGASAADLELKDGMNTPNASVALASPGGDAHPEAPAEKSDDGTPAAAIFGPAAPKPRRLAFLKRLGVA